LVQNLTTTIDDFRNFYKPNKESDFILLHEPIHKALSIIRGALASDSIEIVEKCTSKNKVKLYSNEIMQVILNILKNAQDNFKEKATKNPKISISCRDSDDKVIIEICDNGGGIAEDILPKIFNPYFSTKMKTEQV
jgi:C4-dicarboxylate-specific signal transduction histidine kinase